MAKATTFKLADYDGRLKAHPEPESSGKLSLYLNGQWELRFPRGFGKGDTVVRAGTQRHPIAVEKISPTSCRVTIGDAEDTEHRGRFDLPETAASKVLDALAVQVESVSAIEERQRQIGSGSWWLAPAAFKGLGLTQSFAATESAYLGGWSGQAKTYPGKSKVIKLDKAGVSLCGIKTIFTIPWEQVQDIDVEGPEAASKRITATRMVTMGVFALAAQKKSKSAVMIVKLRSGEEAVFQTQKFAAGELRGKLAPITSYLRRAGAAVDGIAAPSEQPLGDTPAASVADELKKLAELKDAGLLTEDEFQGQKAKLLGA